MNYVLNIEIIIIFIFGFLIRSIFILKYGWFGSDTFRNYRHGKEIDLLGEIPQKSPRVIGDINYGYPPLLPYIISFVSKKHHKGLQYLSPLFDILSSILGYIFLSHATGNYYISIIAISVYLFSPILVYQSVSLNTRQIASFFATISIYFLYLSISKETNVEVFVLSIISALFASLIPLLNRVTLQSLYVTILGVSFYYSSFTPLIIIPLSILFSIIITNGYIIKSFIEHYRIIKAHYLVKTDVYSFFALFISVIKWFPFIIIFPLILQNIGTSEVESFSLAWLISILIISFFWIFGRGWFHITNGVLPFCFLLGYMLKEYQINIEFYKVFLHVFSVSCLVGCVALITLFKKIPKKILSIFKDYSVDNDLMKCFNFLNEKLNEEALLFCIPSRGHLVNGAGYFTNSKILDGGGKSPESHEFGIKELFAFDMTNKNFVKILIKFDFKYLILQKKYVNVDVAEELIIKNTMILHVDTKGYFLLEIIDAEKLIYLLPSFRDLSKNIYKLMGTNKNS